MTDSEKKGKRAKWDAAVQQAMAKQQQKTTPKKPSPRVLTSQTPKSRPPWLIPAIVGVIAVLLIVTWLAWPEGGPKPVEIPKDVEEFEATQLLTDLDQYVDKNVMTLVYSGRDQHLEETGMYRPPEHHVFCVQPAAPDEERKIGVGYFYLKASLPQEDELAQLEKTSRLLWIIFKVEKLRDDFPNPGSPNEKYPVIGTLISASVSKPTLPKRK